ncbi:MAG: hypothetical protein R6W92_05965, partial [Desulfocurvibacter africanus]
MSKRSDFATSTYGPHGIIQIEVSSACDLRCPTCPRTTFSDHWRSAHFPLAALDGLLPHAARAELTYLQ